MIFRFLLLGVVCLFSTNVWSADTIHVATAGTLSSLMGTTGKQVKLTGFINGSDVKFLREQINGGKVTSLDLADVRIVAGGVAYNESYTTTNDVLGDYMFADCSKLRTVTLPTTIKAIGRYAFSKTGISKVDIPNTVTTLGKSAFYNCTSHGQPHHPRLYQRAGRLQSLCLEPVRLHRREAGKLL